MGLLDSLLKVAVEEVTQMGTDAALNAKDIADEQKALIAAIRIDATLSPDEKQAKITKLVADGLLAFGQRSADGVLASLQKRLQGKRDALKDPPTPTPTPTPNPDERTR